MSILLIPYLDLLRIGGSVPAPVVDQAIVDTSTVQAG